MNNRIILACLLTLLAAPALSHGVVLTYNAAQQGTARGDGPFVIGSRFQVGPVDQLITHLGAQDVDDTLDARDPDGADGLSGFADDDGFVGAFIDVGLWNDTGTTLLASARVTSADPAIGSWRWKALTSSLILPANGIFLIGATVGSGIEFFIDDFNAPTPFAAGAGFTLLENRFTGGAALAAPTSNGGGPLGRWGAANAAAFIPEPASVTLLVLAAGAIVRRRRRMA